MRVFVIARDEVLRLLSTRRGIFSLLGFLLLWVAVINYAILPAASYFAGANESGLSEALLPRFGLTAWQQWPAPELAVYWVISLYLLPFFAVVAAADQTASDRSRGTLRFLVLRCSRLEIFFGRFLGQCIIMALVVLCTLASVLIAIALRSPELLPESVGKTPVIVVNLLFLVMPYIALMAWVSIMAKSARQATLLAVIVWIGVSLVIAFIKSRVGDLPILEWVLPGSQVGQLLRLADWQMLTYASAPLIHTIVLLAVGGLVMRSRDL